MPTQQTLTGSDNCGSAIVTASVDDYTVDKCAGYAITYRWSIVDECGNAGDDVTVTFNVLPDTQAPTFDAMPDPIADIHCYDELPIQQTLTGSDDCGSATVTASVDDYTVDKCAGYAITYRWSIVDECGNAGDDVTVTFNVLPDTQAPTISTAASDETVSCADAGNLATWLANNGNASANDDCGTVTWTNDFVSLSDGCGATGTALVTFTATDDCGNTTTTSANFTIIDDINPTITNAASDLTVETDGNGNTSDLNAWLANHAGATATDDCGSVTWSNNFTSLSNGCGTTGSATVTFTATDECGNTSTTSATFTIEDTQAPIINPSASDLTVECDGQGNTTALNNWLANHGGAQASDVGGTVYWSNNFTGLSNGCGATGSANVVFTATDACGNTSTTTAIFTIEDNTPPTLTGAPSNITIYCDGSNAQLNNWLNTQGGASATDNCGGINWSYDFDINFYDCSNYEDVLVTFTATDDCGNAINTQAKFTTKPSCTQLISPVNFSNNVDVNTDLTWAPAPGYPMGYFLTVGSYIGGNDILNHVDVGNVTTYDIPTLPFNTIIYVSITPYFESGYESTGCGEEQFATMADPGALPCTSLSVPANGATDVDILTNLSWDAVTDATGYYLTIGTVPGGTNIINHLNVGNVTTYYPGPLSFNTNYYVTISPYNIYGETSGCFETHFSTAQGPGSQLTCTQLASPLDGSVNVDVDADLIWDVAPTASGYILTVGTTPGGTDIVDHLDVGPANEHELTTLPAGTFIYVTIIPYDEFGPMQGGCEEESFLTAGNAPSLSCTNLTSPVSGSFNVPTDIDLTWQAVANADGYYLNIGTSPNATDIVNNANVVSTNHYQLNGLPYETTIYVTITPYNSNVSATGCAHEYFTTGTFPAPLCTTILTPANGATDVDVNTTITWNPVLNAIGYYLNAGTSPGATDLMNYVNANGTSYTPDFPEGITVYLTVTPYNSAGLALGCNEISFTTASATSPCTVSANDFQLIGTWNGHSYYLSNASMNFASANALAIANGGYITSITSQAENDFIHANVHEIVLIGINDQTTESYLAWTNAEPVTYTNYNICNFCGPNTADNDFTIMHPWDGQWSFVNQWVAKRFVLEVECTANTFSSSFAQTKIREVHNDFSLSEMYPNPVNQTLFVKLESKTEQAVQISITNSLGRSVYTESNNLLVGKNRFSFDVNSWPNGVYFLTIVGTDNREFIKFVKQ